MKQRGSSKEEVTAIAARVITRAIRARALLPCTLAEYADELSVIGANGEGLSQALLERLAYDLLHPSMGSEDPVDPLQAIGLMVAELGFALTRFETGKRDVEPEGELTPEFVTVHDFQLASEPSSPREARRFRLVKRQGEKMLRFDPDTHSRAVEIQQQAREGRPTEALRIALAQHGAAGGLTLREISYFSGDSSSDEPKPHEITRTKWYVCGPDTASLWENGEKIRAVRGRPRKERRDLIKNGFFDAA